MAPVTDDLNSLARVREGAANREVLLSTANRWRRTRVALVALALLVVSQPAFLNSGAVFSASVVLLAGLALHFVGWQRAVPGSAVLFFLWATSSALWTHDRLNYVYAMIALAGTLAIGFAVATYANKEIVRGLLIGSTSILAASFALGQVAPQVARASTAFQTDALVGIYSNKNSLATVLVIGVAACLGSLPLIRRGCARLVIVLVGAAHYAALLETKSSSGIVVASVLIGLFIVVRVVAGMSVSLRVSILPVIAVLVGGIGVPWTLRSLDAIAQWLGRDLTLTGRTEIWRIVIERINREPLVGYGWGGVWRTDIGASIQGEFGSIAANSAHNGYLEVALQLGTVGLVLYLLIVVPAVARATRLASLSNQYLWAPILLTSLLLYNLTEARAVHPVGLFILAVVSGAVLRADKSWVEARQSAGEPGRTVGNTDADRMRAARGRLLRGVD